MSRKLVITPFNHGSIESANNIVNNIILGDHEKQFDITHIVLSAIAMAGVDSIYSMIEIKSSDTKLIKDVISTDSIEKWDTCVRKVNDVFTIYKQPNLNEAEYNQINYFSYLIIDLLFAVETNS